MHDKVPFIFKIFIIQDFNLIIIIVVVVVVVVVVVIIIIIIIIIINYNNNIIILIFQSQYSPYQLVSAILSRAPMPTISHLSLYKF